MTEHGRSIVRRLFFIPCVAALVSCGSAPFVKRPRQDFSMQNVRFTMIHVPGMEFPGGDPGITALPDDRPDVIGVPGNYWLAETNTTYALWRAVYGWAIENGYEFDRPGRMGTEEKDARMNDQHPVTLVDWASAAAWCNALTEMCNLETGSEFVPVYEHEGKAIRKPVLRTDAGIITANPDADGFRLPTGLEWELAARYSADRKDDSYTEYPRGSGHFWAPFLVVSGELEYQESQGNRGGNVEYGSIVSRPVQSLERNDLGFTGFAGRDGKLWQWCYEFLFYRGLRQDSFALKRGGSRTSRCGRHDAWPRNKVMSETCNGFDQITFRVARNAGPAAE